MTVNFTRPAPIAELVGELSGRGADPEVRAVVEEVWTQQESDARPIDGAMEALSRLRVHGVRFAILSNIWLPYLRAVRKHFGEFIDDYVPPELQFFSFQQGFRKPSLEIFNRAITAAGAFPGEAVMIGDTYKTDIAPAIALGLRTVWLLEQPEREKAALAQVINRKWAAPSLTLSSLAELSAELIESSIPQRSHAGGCVLSSPVVEE